MISLNQKLVEYLNTESLRVLNLMTDSKLDIRKRNKNAYQGSVLEQPTFDLSKYLENSPIRMSTTSLNGKKLDWKECVNEKCFGFDEFGFNEFLELAKKFHKNSSVRKFVSLDFTTDSCLDWFSKKYKEPNFEDDFSVFVVSAMEESIKEYTIIFPLLYIDISASVNLGNTKISYLTQDNLDRMECEYKKKVPDSSERNIYPKLRSQFSGRVIISYSVKAEIEKAKQLSYEECSLAVDILKVCSWVSTYPEYYLDFDIDSRTTLNLENHVIYSKDNFPEDVSITTYRAPNHFSLTPEVWNEMLKNYISEFHLFIKNKDELKSELYDLIVNSIKLYAAGVSKKNLHNRIVNLFTILESLLLKNENSSIIDSISKYLPILISNSPEERKKIASVVKKLYVVRSAKIHHAVEKDYELSSLYFLQRSCLMLLRVLVQKTKNHKTKHSILDEIDERLINV